MQKLLRCVGLLIVSGLFVPLPAFAGKKGEGVSCKQNSDCASNYCKPNKAHLPGYVGTCQKR
jgi:hypothetical protein